jgi:hypothetical protein
MHECATHACAGGPIARLPFLVLSTAWFMGRWEAASMHNLWQVPSRLCSAGAQQVLQLGQQVHSTSWYRERQSKCEQCTGLTWASSRQSGWMRLSHSGSNVTTKVAGPACWMRPPPSADGRALASLQAAQGYSALRHAAARMELHDCHAGHVSGPRCSMLAAQLEPGRCC